MKRIANLLILASLAGQGCVALDTNWAGKPAQTVIKEPAQPPPPPPIVLPGQINERNASEMLSALREELDYAGSQQPKANREGMRKE